ncbi:tRNA uridine-5-carboxymethylaminomethyl(34) synthesis GTPase MnmE [Desulfatiferula olefinivorans]
MAHGTIAALSTPTGRGGIGIIRLSGPDALSLACSVFVLPDHRVPGTLPSHHVTYGFVQDEQQRIIDEVLIIYMKGPRSYTAEDVVEIQSHASPIVLRKILDLLYARGARPADPGEFTKRAYLNGRIDLTQAEAVIDIINARTASSLDMALSQVQGELRRCIQSVVDSLSDLQARIEAALDFPDDVGDILDSRDILTLMCARVQEPLLRLKKNFNDGNIYRDGLRVVIAGPPNSGKSSLLNALLDKDKAIVTPIPGTTRDLIDDLITIDGIPFELTDTAGIHDTRDQVEQMGIARTLDRMESADVILLMVDGSRPMDDAEKETLVSLYQRFHTRKIVVRVENKVDLGGSGNAAPSLFDPDIRISALHRTGLDQLKTVLADAVLGDLPEDRSSVVPNARHMHLIEKALQACDDIIKGVNDGRGVELTAEDVASCVDALNDILGSSVREDLLDRIFQGFCIGK